MDQPSYKIVPTEDMLLALLTVIRMKKPIIILFVLLILVVVYFSFNPIVITRTEKVIIQPEQEVYSNYTRRISIRVPAVDEKENGVIVELSVETKPGMGRTLVDINQILFWVDTQSSIRIAKLVAQNITDIDLSEYDIIYSIQTNASAIEGPSAGAAMGIATIMALENRTINENVTITGTLKSDGRIGKVSAVLEKAKAVKNANMSLFLVPYGQKVQTTYKEEKKCESYVFTTYCHVETIKEEVDIEKEVGIRIEEVGDVQEALKYFIT